MTGSFNIALLLTSLLIVAIVLLVMARYRKHCKKKILRRNRETWSIGIYEGKSPLELSLPKGITNPVLTAKDVSDISARFVADPFMIKNNTGYHLFFEVLNNKRNMGEIAYAFSHNGLQWNYRKVILQERFHLSYPYVFMVDGEYYMIPECMGSGGIQLYRATHFPDEWQHSATLIKGKDRFSPTVDPSIIYCHNRWYLFSYAGKSKNLHLFSAETITGPWKEHPKSPVVRNSPHFARPGGRVILYHGAIYRYAQDEVPNYGTKVWAFRITELTENTYREELASEEPVVQPGHEYWNKDGMHTVDPHQRESGEWFALVDGFTIKQQTLKR
jgi:hypothetical protein